MDILHLNEPSFQWEPSYGATVSFSALRDSFIQGDNHKKIIGKGVNSITMKASLSFDVLTDDEAQKIVSFLQSRTQYEPQSYSSDGSFSNKRITPFVYQLFYPYKVNNFYCHSFSHTKQYYNVNTVKATFECAHSTILDSIETYRGYNNNYDYNGIDGLMKSIGTINKSSSPQNISFSTHGNSVDLKPQVNIFPSGSYKNVEISSSATSSPLDVTSNFSVPSTSEFVIPNTPSRNSIYINNPNDCSYYPYNPSVEGGFIENRVFDFRPSQSVTISHSPKILKSKSSDIYRKYSKYGFNPNLTNLSLNFNQRSDLEAKRILLFLEAHLGHRKFAFHLPEPYRNNIDDLKNKSPHRRRFSYFYCPEWSHTSVYKNNHTISARFLECLDY